MANAILLPFAQKLLGSELWREPFDHFEAVEKMVAGSSFARHSLDPAEGPDQRGTVSPRSRPSIVVSVATAHQAAKVQLSTAL
jgi:hypothetical protein